MPVLKRSYLSYTKRTDDYDSDSSYSDNEKNSQRANSSTDISTTQSQDDKEKHDDESSLKPVEIEYSFLKPFEKYLVIVQMGLVSFAGFLSMHMVFPAMSAIKAEFHVGTHVGSHIFVVYFLSLAFGTIVFCDAADVFGRRPTLLISYFLYMLSNVALALAPNYVAFLIFRCLQAVFMAAPPYVAVAVVTDLTGVANRTTFLSIYFGIYFIGNIIGPSIGAAICTAYGWRAIFVFLSLLSGALCVIYAVALPETFKAIVGPKGTLLPQKWTWITVAPILKFDRFASRIEKNEDPVTGERIELPKPKRFNPVAPLKLLWSRPVQCALMCDSLAFAVAVNMTLDLHSLLKNVYQLNKTQIALGYLPSGFASWLSSFFLGFVARYTYSFYLRYAVTQNKPFNLLRSRLVLLFVPYVFLLIGGMLYGWAIQYKWNLGVVLVASFLVNFNAYCIIGTVATIMIDLHPNQATGAVSLTGFQPILSTAIFVSVHGYLSELGPGLEYTILIAIASLGLCGAVFSYFYD